MTDGQESRIPEGFAERVQSAEGELLPPAIDGIYAARIPASNLIDFMESLKEGPGLKFELLIDVCSVDEYENKPRFDVIYHLRSVVTGDMVRIKVFAQGNPPEVPSMVPLYPTANWHEREAYDMMGIRFAGHPDLKRILMPLEYEGHPLRKDFPREGIEPDRLYKQQYPD
ncbi:MAG: NADH-quinone oxidoreductase subunit C [Planctomycetota bacterium]